MGLNNGSYQEILDSSLLTLDAWSHVAGTWDGSTLRVYVNGTPVANRAAGGTLDATANPLHIGGNALWGEYLDGVMDEVRIYNRALSQTEIQTDMNTPIESGAPPPTSTPTPTGTPTQTPTPSRTPTRTSTPTPTSTSAGFPTTNVLDDFDRGNGSIGGNWSGDTAGYSVASNRLDVGAGEDIYWNVSAWGANQEAFVTLTTIDPNGGEQDLLLKSQSSTDWTSGVLEVWYDAAHERVQVWTYTEAQNWVQRGGDIAVTFANGDQFGARATADGQVKVYRNGTLLATQDVTGWPYYAEGGYIGLWFINASNAVLDDFGGGTATQASVGPDGGRARGLAAPAPEKGPSFLTRLLDWLRSLFSPTPPRAVNAHPPVAVPYAGPAAPLSAPPEGQTWRTYYYAGSVRVAMRVETSTQNEVYYLHGDHLGSASLATDSNGAVVPNSPTRYYPFGGTRYGGGGLPTDRRFTGQRAETGLGSLYDYGARFYSSALGRFLSADTIVPSPGNPQSLNRYSYVLNNTLRYTDPTGRRECDDAGHCGPVRPLGLNPYGIRFTADEGVDWDAHDVGEVLNAATTSAGRMASSLRRANWLAYKTGDALPQHFSSIEVFNQAMGTVTFHRSAGACPAQNGCWAWTRPGAAGMAITVYTSNNRKFGVGAGEYTYQNAAHELGHAFAHRAHTQPYDDLQAEWDANSNFPRRDPANVKPNGYAGLRFTWQQSSDLSPNEEFADMFLGWAYGRWEIDRNGTMTPAGQARSQWMTTNMAYWITLASGQ